MLSNAKFKGYNGINVDMSEEDSETFDIRLDNTITRTIELLNTRVNTNKTFIDNLTNTSIIYNGEVTTDRYGRKVPKHAHGTINIDHKTSSAKNYLPVPDIRASATSAPVSAAHDIRALYFSDLLCPWQIPWSSPVHLP